MTTRNHGNRLLLVNEQNEFFYFRNKNVYVFKKLSTKKFLSLIVFAKKAFK